MRTRMTSRQRPGLRIITNEPALVSDAGNRSRMGPPRSPLSKPKGAATSPQKPIRKQLHMKIGARSNRSPVSTTTGRQLQQARQHRLVEQMKRDLMIQFQHAKASGDIREVTSTSPTAQSAEAAENLFSSSESCSSTATSPAKYKFFKIFTGLMSGLWI